MARRGTRRGKGRPEHDDVDLLRRLALEKRRHPKRPYRHIAEELAKPLAQGDYVESVVLRLVRKERKLRAELVAWADAHSKD